MNPFNVHPDIKKASTPDSKIYSDSALHNEIIENAFRQSWLYVTDSKSVRNWTCFPFKLFGEPLMITKSPGDDLKCLSNVCTHRGNILIKEPANHSVISCRYHGKCFDLNGNFKSMPEFEQAENFPSANDNLPELPLHQWHNFIFTHLQNDPSDFGSQFPEMVEMMDWYPFERLKRSDVYSKIYKLKANWMLYCENYMEGFHVPFVHHTLKEQIEYGNYETRLFEHSILQVGYAQEGQPHFNDEFNYHGSDKPFAFYWYLFPNIMINFYTWGVSVNIVEPVDAFNTKIIYETFPFDNDGVNDEEAAVLDSTEMEDEEIVLAVQEGVGSSFYKSGRYSPSRETGVHHFHRLMAAAFK